MKVGIETSLAAWLQQSMTKLTDALNGANRPRFMNVKRSAQGRTTSAVGEISSLLRLAQVGREECGRQHTLHAGAVVLGVSQHELLFGPDRLGVAVLDATVTT